MLIFQFFILGNGLRVAETLVSVGGKEATYHDSANTYAEVFMKRTLKNHGKFRRTLIPLNQVPYLLDAIFICYNLSMADKFHY